MSSDKLRNTVELVGIFGLLASLIFVGLELRASNVQARAAAFQAIGIATSEFHQTMDDRLNLLYEQAFDPGSIQAWSYTDWLAVDRRVRADVRLFETTFLQVDQGLLPEAAINNLGFAGFGNGFLSVPAIVCLWPRLSQGPGAIGPRARQWIEDGTPVGDRPACPVDLPGLRESYMRQQEDSA
ncbi:MAG: hypothetical protein V2I57_05660 [Xanthomonadales bacterium]|jgi:hypothetical protein|nr:hypothetical protein [Xanthomonadales bacterium]